MRIRLPYKSFNKYVPITMKAQCCANDLFETIFLFPIIPPKRANITKKELRYKNSKLISYITDRRYSYSSQAHENVELICHDRKIYVPKTLRRRLIDWYHFYLNHPDVSRLAKKYPRSMLLERLCRAIRAGE